MSSVVELVFSLSRMQGRANKNPKSVGKAISPRIESSLPNNGKR
jgi:hypothetical protein